MFAMAVPSWAQFGTKQTNFRNTVVALNGPLDVHGVGSGTVSSGGTTITYSSDQHVTGTLKLDTYNTLTGALTGTLNGTITISETSIIDLGFGCTITNTFSASTTAQSDYLGHPLTFSLSFDIGSDTWSLWPSNNSVNGTENSVATCGVPSSGTVPMRFMPINMSMGFPFPDNGFDLIGTRQVVCLGCGNADSNPVTYTFTYNLIATTKDCTVYLSASSLNLAAAAASGSFNVDTGAGCAWAALPLDPWITIDSGASGNGSGTVAFSVSANATGAPRSGGISVGAVTLPINQAVGGSKKRRAQITAD